LHRQFAQRTPIRVARPSRQRGRVAQRQEAAPCAFFVMTLTLQQVDGIKKKSESA